MENRESKISRMPYVVTRNEIPVSFPGNSKLESRAFHAQERLANAMYSASTALSWIQARSGDYSEPHRQAEAGLLIILRGSAELFGSERRTVEQGDVVTLPQDHEYGFTSVAPGGLEALQVLFLDNRSQDSEKEITLDDVLARNEVRLQAWLATPYFGMLQDGTLSSSGKRTRFKRCIRVFSDFFQTFLFTRQAMCREDEYHATFSTHLAEEFGHNNMLEATTDPRIGADASLQATLSWFCHQMLILDNVGKAIINLVLESGGYHFHNLAKPVFESDDVAGYFGTHAEDDATHKDLGLELLERQHPLTYRKLLGVLDDGWNMLEATTHRIFEIVHLEEAVS